MRTELSEGTSHYNEGKLKSQNSCRDSAFHTDNKGLQYNFCLLCISHGQCGKFPCVWKLWLDHRYWNSGLSFWPQIWSGLQKNGTAVSKGNSSKGNKNREMCKLNSNILPHASLDAGPDSFDCIRWDLAASKHAGAQHCQTAVELTRDQCSWKKNETNSLQTHGNGAPE